MLIHAFKHLLKQVCIHACLHVCMHACMHVCMYSSEMPSCEHFKSGHLEISFFQHRPLPMPPPPPPKSFSPLKMGPFNNYVMLNICIVTPGNNTFTIPLTNTTDIETP